MSTSKNRRLAAYAAKEVELIWLNIEPVFDPIRQDARFQNLLNRVEFPRELKN